MIRVEDEADDVGMCSNLTSLWCATDPDVVATT